MNRRIFLGSVAGMGLTAALPAIGLPAIKPSATGVVKASGCAEAQWIMRMRTASGAVYMKPCGLSLLRNEGGVYQAVFSSGTFGPSDFPGEITQVDLVAGPQCKVSEYDHIYSQGEYLAHVETHRHIVDGDVLNVTIDVS